jgi:hypothetical protein
MEAVPHMRKFVLAGAIATMAAFATTAPAYGGGCSGNSSDPASSVAQYTEPTPTACGDHITGSAGNSKRTVPKSIQKKIDSEGGADAQQLEKIVSSESAGAPTTPIKTHPVKAKKTKGKNGKAHKSQNPSKIISDSETRKSNPLAASVGVITDGSDGRLIALIALMLGVAAIVVVSAFRRRRVTR